MVGEPKQPNSSKLRPPQTQRGWENVDKLIVSQLRDWTNAENNPEVCNLKPKEAIKPIIINNPMHKA